MRILIDIGHPAHVHYFKNFIKIMRLKGHKFLVTARDKEIVHLLLDKYGIKYTNRGKGGDTTFGKVLYLLKGDFLILKAAFKFKPDLFLSFASPYAAQTSSILGKPHIAFDDTEHAKFSRKMYFPFTETILTPKEFKVDLGNKQIRFDATMDIAYLSKGYFKPNYSILKNNNLNEYEKIFFLRFVSWAASHDKGYSGFSIEGKRKLVKILSEKGRVIISAEEKLPSEFSKYAITISPEKVHDLLYYCDLFVGESGSMATEAAILGTPSIIVNSSVHHFGVFTRIIKYNSLFAFSDELEAIKKIKHLLTLNFKQEAKKISRKIIDDSINLTDFMIWFIENYPKSAKIMKDNPDYQNRFR